MDKDTFDLLRVKTFLERDPNADVIIIANGRELADSYWKRIKEHLGIEKRPYIITNGNTWDGYPFADSLVLKIGRWWENRNAREVMLHTKLAKLTLPITYIPPFERG
ncbi:hypothetical protein ACFSKI_19150 [Pseudogracilibacillus auburnensis]|uniref:Uncharacterized protein n=3 Tax=Pseudogracilibacillus auburnensis TaxID=1494959 RepID=A0A2V3W9A9_9BACI|nr:hypothetical protein [Pseudogracilibacillus auburnensis]PXW88815.1 hypothetical protein DFR56_103321 [Pseudogracilibacillus auburnensis]